MAVLLDIPSSLQDHLQAEATLNGISVHDLLLRTISERYPATVDDDSKAMELIK